jgi:hypothetical protein
MQPVRIAIEINPRDIPSLVCSDCPDAVTKSGYAAAISEALAEVLGVKDYLHRTNRMNELRRILWEKDQRSEI